MAMKLPSCDLAACPYSERTRQPLTSGAPGAGHSTTERLARKSMATKHASRPSGWVLWFVGGTSCRSFVWAQHFGGCGGSRPPRG